MASLQSRGNTVVATGATGTWSATTSAYDGAVGTNPATYATWVNAARSTSSTITIGGYTFSGVSGGATISSVTAAIRHLESSTSVIASVTVQLQDSTGANVGSAITATLSTTVATNTLTVGTPTAAQVVGGLRILVTITRANSTTSTTFSLDQVDVTVNYTNPAAVHTLTDNFNTKDTTKWVWGGAAAVSGGQLVIPPDSAGANYIYAAVSYDLTNDACYVQVVQQGNGTAGDYQPFRLGNVGTNNYLEFSLNGLGALGVAVYVAATSVHSNSYTYDPVAHAWLRIRHSSGTVYFDTSPDSVTWTNLDSWVVSGFDITWMTPTFFGGVLSSGTATQNSIYDNVNLPATTAQTFFAMF
jgi:hypothetical protein